MAGLSLPELEAERDRLYTQLAGVGDFRRGSVSENYRKCGKPNCACARPGILATVRGSCGPGLPGDAAPWAGSWPPGRWARCAGRSAGIASSRRSASRSRR